MPSAITLYFVGADKLTALHTGSEKCGDVILEEGALPPDFIIESAIAGLRRGENPLWCSFFLFVKDERAVGSGGFKGAPVHGRVEIGYGISESHRCKGFATEAVKLLVEEALTRAEVFEVLAETSAANVASRRVVEKAGFRYFGQRDTASDGVVDQWLIQRSRRDETVVTGV